MSTTTSAQPQPKTIPELVATLCLANRVLPFYFESALSLLWTQRSIDTNVRSHDLTSESAIVF